MAEYLDEAGLTEVWNKATDAFASSDHTHTGYASTSHTHSNATTSSAGFLRKLNGSTTQFLNGAGNWVEPTSSGASIDVLYTNNSGNSGSCTLSKAASNYQYLIVGYKAGSIGYNYYNSGGSTSKTYYETIYSTAVLGPDPDGKTCAMLTYSGLSGDTYSYSSNKSNDSTPLYYATSGSVVKKTTGYASFAGTSVSVYLILGIKA